MVSPLNSSTNQTSPSASSTQDEDLNLIDPCKEVELMLASQPDQRHDSLGGGLGFSTSGNLHFSSSKSISSYDHNIIKLVRANIACDRGLVGSPQKKDTIYMTREKAIQIEQEKKAEQVRQETLRQKRAQEIAQRKAQEAKEAAEAPKCIIS